MHYAAYDCGPWKRETPGRLWRILVAAVTSVFPKANPDFDKSYERAVHWWFEILESGLVEREIAFDSAGTVVAISPVGENIGIFAGYAAPTVLLAGPLPEAFELAWTQFETSQGPMQDGSSRLERH